MGIVKAGFSFAKKPVARDLRGPPVLISIAVLLILAFLMIRIPLANAGRPEDPAPPTAIM